MDVTGIILADGKNPKMGGNKGTELIGGTPCIERVIQRLAPINQPDYSRNRRRYAHFFPPSKASRSSRIITALRNR